MTVAGPGKWRLQKMVEFKIQAMLGKKDKSCWLVGWCVCVLGGGDLERGDSGMQQKVTKTTEGQGNQMLTTSLFKKCPSGTLMSICQTREQRL